MQSISDICNETGLTADDVRLILSDLRPDWETTETITHNEADLIRQSAHAALPGSNGEIVPVADMDFTQQQQLIDNASQVLNSPLVLAVARELKNLDSLHQVKNAIALNIIEKRQAELDAVIREQSEVRQKAYETAIQDLASQMQKPVSVAEEMLADIKAGDARVDAILAKVRAGK